MATTLQQILDIEYQILRELESDTSAYPVSLLTLLSSAAQQTICFGAVVNPVPINGKITGAQKGQLPFLNVDKFYSNIASVSLSDDLTVGATVITTSDTTYYPTSGKIYIAGNIISYTGKTSTTFTGCTNVLFPFESGLQISPVFDLPDDYSSVINVVYNDTFKLDGKLYDDVYEELNGVKGVNCGDRDGYAGGYGSSIYAKPFYTIKDNQYLIPWNTNLTGGIIRMRYEKVPTEMTATTDLATIPNDIYVKLIIPYYALGHMFYNRGEEDRAAKLLNVAVSMIQEMYDHYNNVSFEEISGTQVRMGKGRGLNL